jgi:cytochrome c-type biogenesis protein CcmH
MCGSVSKIFLALSVALSVGTAYADERSEALDRQATVLYQQVFSPFCPGRSLNDCPSSKAAELKDQMRAELEAGKAPDVILNEVFQKYGDQYRAVPQFSGVGVLVWLVPIAFVVIGLVFAIVASSRRKRRASAEAGSNGPALSAEDERRIQDELSRLE